jgi:hypothetical protein
MRKGFDGLAVLVQETLKRHDDHWTKCLPSGVRATICL